MHFDSSSDRDLPGGLSGITKQPRGEESWKQIFSLAV